MARVWNRFAMGAGVGIMLLTGCDGKPRLHPVSGKALRKGQPVDNGGFLFVDDARPHKGLTFNALIDKEGQFEARTLEIAADGTKIHPGIPEGKYRVIYHPASDGQKTGLEIELAQTLIVPLDKRSLELVVPDELPRGLGQERDDAPPTPPDNPPAVQRVDPQPKKDSPSQQEPNKEKGTDR